MVRPHGEAENGDTCGREGNGAIAKDRLSRMRCDHLADDAEARQNHDVDSWVRVEPEDVLVDERVAATSDREEMCAHLTVEHRHELCTGDEGGCCHNECGRGKVGPDEQRHAEERHARCAHRDNRDEEVDRRRN